MHTDKYSLRVIRRWSNRIDWFDENVPREIKKSTPLVDETFQGGGKGLHYFVKIDNQFPCPRHSAHFHEINVPFTPLTVNVKTENTIILSIERVKLFQWGGDFRCVKYPHNIIFRIFHRRLSPSILSSARQSARIPCFLSASRGGDN